MMRFNHQIIGILCLITALLLACDQESSIENHSPHQDLPPLGNTFGEDSDSSQLGGQAGIMGGLSTHPPSAGELLAGQEGGFESAGIEGGSTDPQTGGDREGGHQAGTESSNIDHTRSCTVTITAYSRAEGPLWLASSFTNWDTAPLAMEAVEETEDGRTRYELVLSAREGIGAELGLEEGVRYPYKLIQQGIWSLNPQANLQVFEGSCTNSAFVIPHCEDPKLTLESMTSEWVEGTGTLSIQGRVFKGIGEASEISTIEAKLDGTTIALNLQRDTGHFNAQITALNPGKHRISLQATDVYGRQSEPIINPFWIESIAFEWGKTPLYMILVDRFANGQTSSDAPIGDPVAPIADWRGGDLQGITEAIQAGYFDELGVRALWLSPINEQVQGHFEDRAGEGRRFAAYHGYWPISGRRVDPRYGGDEGLRALISAAHERGIRVLLDLINNQVHEQHEYYLTHPDWFRTSCVCGAEAGCGWSERPLDCLFASYLPDINWRSPEAEAQFIADALYWVEEFDVDGFRVDAVKHVETTSIYNLRHALTQRFEQGGERIWMFGETAVGESDRFDDGCGVRYENGYEWIDAYTGKQGLDGQFDFPTHHRTRHALLQANGDLQAVSNAYEDATQRYRASEKHVRFLGSHDTPRISSESAGDLTAPCVWPGQNNCTPISDVSENIEVMSRLKRAWTALYLSPGTPLLYYGDEIALTGAADPDNRRAMPWEGDLSHLNLDSLNPLTETQRDLRSWISALGQLRARSQAVAYGELIPLWRSSECYIFARLDEDARGVIVAINRGDEFSESLNAPRAWSTLEEQLIRSLSTSPTGENDLSLTLSGGLITLSLRRGEVAIFERR